MGSYPARKLVGCLIIVITLLFGAGNLVLLPVSTVSAAGTGFGTFPTPTSGAPASSNAKWAFDPEVTEVGKNADRARQLLWWVFSHPGVHRAEVFVQLWAFSRNIVYAFVILVIIAFGFSFILLRKRASAVNIPPLLLKIGFVLIYVTFSYLIILGLMQLSDVIMKFFIEHVGGQNLFNVIFAGPGNIEQNYTTFVGYRDINPLNKEMVNTSIFLIRLTSLTYYAMAIILVLRTIILWFLLIISPFLALLMPFVFIRNIGWIWIGVFFQWLFYGPLLALFLGSLTKIWVAGIPFPFDFTRRNTAPGQVYRTAINILYGGPAQTLSAGNSANYVDTYAEYVISLIMLWTAMILPWLLLRIFRDYCCELLATANSTLTAIFDRMRQYPPPAPPQPTGPTTTAAIAAELPFRAKIEEKIKEVHKTNIENIQEISRASTSEIIKTMDMSVSSLSDVSRLEMDQIRRNTVTDQLRKIAVPDQISNTTEREKYAVLKSELKTRAIAGDQSAGRLLSATGKDKTEIINQMEMISAGRPTVAGLGRTQTTFAPSTTIITSISQPTTTVDSKRAATAVTGVPLIPTIPTRESLQEITTAGRVSGVKAISVMPVQIAGKTVQSQVSIEDYEEVKKMWIKHYREAPVPTTETISSREEWLSTDIKKLTNISDLLAGSDSKLRQKGLEEVAELLPFLLLGGFSDVETLTYIKAKLEAAKQIQSELEMKEKVKEEMKKEKEEEFVEVTGTKKETKKKEGILEAELKMEVPKEKSNKQK